MSFFKTNSKLNINTNNFERLKNEGHRIIDVRTLQENEEIRIENSVLIDIYSPDFPDKISHLEKSGKYLVYCRSGNRSLYAVKFMKSTGFPVVFNLSGGIIEWEKSGKPVIKGSDNTQHF